MNYRDIKPNEKGVVEHNGILNEAYSMNRYGILKDRIQEQLGVSSKQAEGYLKPFANGKMLYVKPSREVNKKIKEDLVKRQSRHRYGILKDHIQEQLGVTEKQAEGYLKPFADGKMLGVEPSREVNKKIKEDLAKRQSRIDKAHARIDKAHARIDKAHDEALNMNASIDRYGILKDHIQEQLGVTEKQAEGYLKPFADGKMLDVEPSREVNKKIKEDLVKRQSRIDKVHEQAIKTNDSINNIINHAPKDAMGQPMLKKREVEIIKALKGQENTAFQSVKAPKFKRRKGAIPTEAKAFKQGKAGAKEAIKKNLVNQAKKEIAQEAKEAAAKKAGRMASLGKVGKIAAGVGIAATVISNMNKSKGQQSNAELYGQRTPYGY